MGSEERYNLREVMQGWREFLTLSAEERGPLKNPFAYKDRDMHLNNCCNVIPDQYKEPLKIAPVAKEVEYPDFRGINNYPLALKFFRASYIPRHPNCT